MIRIGGLLNTCWLPNPNMKYFCAKVIAGAILYNCITGLSLLITCVEVYGRNSAVDPHFENPALSYPPTNALYKRVWPTTVKTNDGVKLVIETTELQSLITSSLPASECTSCMYISGGGGTIF